MYGNSSRTSVVHYSPIISSLKRIKEDILVNCYSNHNKSYKILCSLRLVKGGWWGLTQFVFLLLPHTSINIYTLCCSCLFVSGRTVVYRSQYKRPKYPPKITYGGPNYMYRLKRLMLRLMFTGLAGLCWRLDRPGRRPSTCVGWQLQHCIYF